VDLLLPDTTAALLIRAELEDSILMKLSFDDYLYPGRSIGGFRVQIESEDTSAVIPQVERLLWQKQLDSLRVFEDSVAAAEEAQARADSLRAVVDSLRLTAVTLESAGDSLGADSVTAAWANAEAELATLEAPPEPTEPQDTTPPPPPSRDLPDQFFYAILDRPLYPEVVYKISASGVRNMVSLPGGGGEVEVTWTPPEVPTDTTGAAADTARIAPDTVGARPDTIRARPRLFRRRP
jgi:hypothetical protein